MIKAIELNKGDKIRHVHLGIETSGVVMESPKQGRGLKRTIVVDVKGSEIGLFDEMGSIYTKQITKAFKDGTWQDVEI